MGGIKKHMLDRRARVVSFSRKNCTLSSILKLANGESSPLLMRNHAHTRRTWQIVPKQDHLVCFLADRSSRRDRGRTPTA